MSDVSEPLRDFLRRFDGLADAEFVTSLGRAKSNETWKVTASGNAFVVKMHVGYTDREQLLREIDLLDELRRRDLPFRIPWYLPDRDGHRIITIGNMTWSVQPYYEGTAADPNAIDQVEASGRALGILHSQMKQPGLRRAWPEGGRSHLFPDPAARARPAIVATPERGATREGIEWLFGTLQAARRDLEPQVASLPHQFIHGDYVPGNVLWDQDGISAILDFEFASLRSRALDVAMALLFFVNYWTGQESFRTIKVFVDGYSISSGLTDAERSILVPLMRAQNLSSAMWWIELALERTLDWPDIDIRLQRTEAYDRWISENVSEIDLVLR